MNRILYTLFLLLSIVVKLLAQTAIAPSAGDGTSGNPYQIATWENLYWITQDNNRLTKHYIQTADIDFASAVPAINTWNSGQGWTPIGNDSWFFEGTYNGNGKTISGLYINRPSGYFQGLFGMIFNGGVSNLGVINANVTGYEVVGILAGNIDANVNNCYSTGIVSGTNSVGGLFGCSSRIMSFTISECFSDATVTGGDDVGGLGGYAGEFAASTIDRCYSTGTVTGTVSEAGGLIGTMRGNVTNCYSVGNVTGVFNTGGFIGKVESGNITNSYSTGLVNGSSWTGGFIGYFNGSITNCFWNTTTSGTSTGVGNGALGVTGKITSEMNDILTFSTTTWDITEGYNSNNVWNIENSINNSYPFLSWTKQSIIYVKHDASGSNNGTSWENAFNSLQDALDLAISGQKIWVAAGTYKPSQKYDGSTTAPREFTFYLTDGVEIYGGFEGTEDYSTFDLNTRDFSSNETILSGDLSDNDIYDISSFSSYQSGSGNDNCYSVLLNLGNSLTDATILDGFTVTGGNANASFPGNAGAGMVTDGNPTLRNIVFYHNSGIGGGSLFILLANGVNLSNLSFIENNGGDGGGGIYFYEMLSPSTITNALFVKNRGVDGGGLENVNSTTTINNASFWGNNVFSYGGAVKNTTNGTLTLNNCIIWNNSADNEGNEIYHDGSTTTLNNCCYKNEANDVFGTITLGSGNINTNPLFVNPEARDLTLFGNSPCLNAGDNAYNAEGFDLRGQARIQNTTIDIGAYEWTTGLDPDNRIIYVNAGASGNDDGTNWANAFISLQSALDAAISGDEIWVAGGTYKPSSAYSLPNTSRNYHFELINNVVIYGGFAATETSVDQRTDYGFGGTNETILSGDIGIEGDNSDNCYHVIYNLPYSVTNSAILNGVSVSGGNANLASDSERKRGGGMYMPQNSPIIRNVTFTGNYGIFGGAVFNMVSSGIYSNCLFFNNSALYGGASMTYSSTALNFDNCTFYGNTADIHGGGADNWNSAFSYNNCIFWGNSSATGNQIYAYGNSTITLNTSCYSSNTNDIAIEAGSSIITTNNNITSDPFFVDAANNNYTLYGNSPCVNTGNNSYNTYPTDIRGEIRIQNTTIDMGAFEWTLGLDPVSNCINPDNGGAISAEQTICYNDTPTEINSSSLPTNYLGTLEYKWQQSVTGSSSDFIDIPFTNTESFSPSNLTQTTWFKRLARVDCQSDWSGAVESNVIEITVLPEFSEGTISSAGETVCIAGDPTEILNILNASGGDDNITYLWKANGLDISDSNSESYNPPAGITVTTIFTRWAKDGLCITNFVQSVGEYTVEPEDNDDPVADETSLPNLTAECEITSLTAPTATDNCAGEITGTHSVTLPITESITIVWNFDDGNGNTSTQNQEVIIDDITAPVADEISLPDLTAECEITSLTAPTATDNCAGEITGTHSVTLPITESTTIVWSFDDGNGNSSTQNQEVIIDDVTPPVADEISLPDLTAECEITSLTAPTATDNCAGEITGTHSVTLPITESITIVWNFDDGNGNISTQNQEVIIDDVTAPTITCVSNQTVAADETHFYTVQGTEFDPTETLDNCGVFELTNNFNSSSSLAGAQFAEGTATIFWTIIDDNGNEASCSFEITVDEYVGINDLLTQNITIYPNPSNGIFTAEFESNDIKTITIKDITGKVIYDKMYEETHIRFDITGNAPGLYFVTFKSKNLNSTFKIVLE